MDRLFVGGPISKSGRYLRCIFETDKSKEVVDACGTVGRCNSYLEFDKSKDVIDACGTVARCNSYPRPLSSYDYHVTRGVSTIN